VSLPIEEFRRQIDVNFIGAVNTIQAFAPLLGIENKLGGHRGRIINISSVSGQMGAPFLTAYSASKFALEGLSESLRRELLPFGIEVIVIVPGLVATPIWSKAEAVDTTPYLDTRYAVALKRLRMYIEFGKRGMPPERLGQVVMDALTVPRPKVRYIVSAHTALLWIARRLPERLIDRILGKYLGLLPARR
jgi:NAD(P)-dependent dehydrogenase (short-subunit alcohol dehydrogenase family)